MKIRNGFVSNSSSSSFILKLPFYPESMDDMRRILLGDENPLVLSYNDEAFPTKRIIEIIYNDVIEAIGEDKKRPIESIDETEFNINKYNINDFNTKVISKYNTEYNKLKKEYLKFNQLWNDCFYLKYDTEEDKRRTENAYYKQMGTIENKIKNIIIESIKEKSLDNDIHISLEYSDNDGSIMSFIEHSDILEPITIVVISHH